MLHHIAPPLCHQPLIQKRVSYASLLFTLCGIQIVLAFEWLKMGWGKTIDPNFAARFPDVLANFADKNPHAAYAAFLEGFATAHAEGLAQLISWGEFAAGTALVVCALWIISVRQNPHWAAAVSAAALAAALFMNANYYFAGGWDKVNQVANVVMFWSEFCLLLFHVSVLRPVCKPSSVAL
ncbi:hypothetical protein HYV73_04890 [Candidatus Uhrbacteria bacterium]|nr:hypothetical protein [Candidatus Uhrbacteria bacterium]